MNTKTLMGGAVAGLIIAGGTVGAISAQTASTETGLTEEQIIARIANSIIVAKGSQNRRRPRRRSWRYNKIVYDQIALLRKKLREDQAEFWAAMIKKDMESNANLTMPG